MGRLPGFSADLSLSDTCSEHGSAGPSARAPDSVRPAFPLDPPEFRTTWVPDGSGHGTLSVTGSNFTPSGAVKFDVHRFPSFIPVSSATTVASPSFEFCPNPSREPCRLYFGGNVQARISDIPCNLGPLEVHAYDLQSGSTLTNYLSTHC